MSKSDDASNPFADLLPRRRRFHHLGGLMRERDFLVCSKMYVCLPLDEILNDDQRGRVDVMERCENICLEFVTMCHSCNHSTLPLAFFLVILFS